MIFNHRGVLWLKIQPQKPPVAKIVVAGHHCGAPYTFRIQYWYTQTQCEDGARDVRVLKLTLVIIKYNNLDAVN